MFCADPMREGGPHRGRSPVRTRAFTLVELLVVVGIVAVLASLLLPVLSKARSRAITTACLNNLKQLQICWLMYPMDHADLLVPNNYAVAVPGSSISLTDAGVSWCLGSARKDTTTTNIENGLLFSYNTSVGIYRCPADQSTIEDDTGNLLPQLRTRSYNMSQSVNGYPEFDPTMRDYIPSFKRLTQIEAPDPTHCLVFIDEHADAMYDALFGMPTDFYDGSQTWWDMPANRHSQGGNLSFADGHVERWKWMVPKIFHGWVQPVPAEEMPDWLRIKATIRQTMN
jgi:prepilin-type processing-associated H-X9-DG protein/prepilin-type N-terminal cleavage/methylation domain-containing protein